MNATTVDPLTLAAATRIVREALRDKTYQLYPLGMEAAGYLRMKRKRLTKGSYRKYEGVLDKLARHFTDLELQEDLRDRLVLRLMLNYALRKGSVRQVRFKHFDHVRKTITVFAKGGTVRTLPIPDPAFWHDLERLILDSWPSH